MHLGDEIEFVLLTLSLAVQYAVKYALGIVIWSVGTQLATIVRDWKCRTKLGRASEEFGMLLILRDILQPVVLGTWKIHQLDILF